MMTTTNTFGDSARPLTSLEARAALEEAEQREKEAHEAAERQRAAHERAVEAFRRDTITQVKDIEARADALLERLADAPAPSIRSRGAFRSWLRGQSAMADDLIAPEQHAAYSDDTANELLGHVREVQGLVNRMVGDAAPVRLGESDDLVQRADKVECALWSAFVARARRCAGEQ